MGEGTLLKMNTRGRKTDPHVRQVLATLREQYGANHPRASIEAYRYNSASIRVRITDPDFAGKDLVDREETIWPIMETLPDDIRSEITVLLLVTPHERKSLMSLEFDAPARSRL